MTHKLSLINDGGRSIWELGAEHGCGIIKINRPGFEIINSH